MTESTESTDTLAKARLRARLKMQNPVKNRKGNYGMYADLESVLDSIMGPCLSEGIEITQWLEKTPEGLVLQTALCLASTGEHKIWSYPLIVEKQSSQGLGASVSYARRYALNSIFCLAMEDNDDEEVVDHPPYQRPSRVSSKIQEPLNPEHQQKKVLVAKKMAELNISDSLIVPFLTALEKSAEKDPAIWDRTLQSSEIEFHSKFESWLKTTGRIQ